MVISISNGGYLKSVPVNTFRKQGRGGVGVAGMELKEGDYIEHLFITTTHHYMLFFTNKGKVYQPQGPPAPAHEPDGEGPAHRQFAAARAGGDDRSGHRDQGVR